MSKKFTFEYVKEQFEKRGYELLETEYKNNNTKMRYKCPEHPDKDTRIRFDHLRRGAGCRHCGNNRKAEKFKFTFDKVKKEFEDRGYTLLEKEYKNNRTKMRYSCPDHPDKDLFITYDGLSQGQGCIYCAGKNKHTLDEVRNLFEERGYALLETKYKNTMTPMRFRCPNHPDKETKMTLSSLKLGRSCLYCAKQAPPTYEEVKKKFEDKGLVLISEKIINSQTPLEYICPNHPHEVKRMTYRHIYRGVGCQECYFDSIKGEGSHYWKGGVHTLSGLLRRKSREWKMEILKENNYKCDVTGENYNKLEVHHTTPFNVIRDKVLKEFGFSKQKNLKEFTRVQLDEIVHRFMEEQSNIKGIPLKKEIHKEFHGRYGHKATLEDYYEFKKEWQDASKGEAIPEGTEDTVLIGKDAVCDEETATGY